MNSQIFHKVLLSSLRISWHMWIIFADRLWDASLNNNISDMSFNMIGVVWSMASFDMDGPGRTLPHVLSEVYPCILSNSWDPVDFSSFDEDEGDNVISDEDILSLSDGEENDAGLLVIPSTDAEFPHRHDLFDKSNAVAVATHRFLTLQGRRRRHRIQPGVFINMGLMAFITTLLLLFDWCSWKIVRLPLRSFFLMRPFAISAILASFAGFLYVPIVDTLKIHQIIRKEGPARHALKNRTPTMGGLFFIPIGITVARAIAGFSSVGVCGAATATLAFAVIGLLDDILSSVKYHNYGLSPLFKFGLLAAVGTWFSFWLDSAGISSPYSMYSFL